MPFFYQNGRLKIGQTKNVDVAEILSGTQGPVYLYDLDDVEKRFAALSQAFQPTKHSLHYAMKANSHAALLRMLGALGSGVDTVSAGEIRRAMVAGIPASRIVFSGVGKTKAEIEMAVTLGIKQINIESPQELIRVNTVAQSLGRVADIAFRINPDVDPKTHPYITTGFRENKFGMDESFLPELLTILESPHSSVRLRGLTMHIGSQLFDLDVMREAIEKTCAIHRNLVAKGLRLDRMDIGGGLGIDYSTDQTEPEFATISEYGRMATQTIQNQLGQLDLEILTEPGRIMVARCGILVGEVQYVKHTSTKTFAILDTGMHHLIRPALYGAQHRILPVLLSRDDTPQSTHQIYDVVGPICESSDFLAKGVSLPLLKQGDRVAIADAGAYGFVMASHYNSHDLPLEIAISHGAAVTV